MDPDKYLFLTNSCVTQGNSKAIDLARSAARSHAAWMSYPRPQSALAAGPSLTASLTSSDVHSQPKKLGSHTIPKGWPSDRILAMKEGIDTFIHR